MRTLISALFVVIILSAGNASAQFLGQMSPASIIETGSGKTGAYFVTAEDAFAVVGSLRYGFSDYMEGRFRFGFIDADGRNTDPHIILGVDAKYLLWKYVGKSDSNTSGGGGGYNNPFDLSLGGGFEYSKFEKSNLLGIGISTIGSIPYHFKNNTAIEPYARFNLRYERAEFDVMTPRGTIDSESDSDFEIGLNIGALFSVTPLVDFTAEFQIDEQMAFMFGIDIATF